MKFDPNEVIHSITWQDLQNTLARHIGMEEANNLSDSDWALLKEELVAVLESLGNDMLDEAIDDYSRPKVPCDVYHRPRLHHIPPDLDYPGIRHQ